MRTPRVRFTVRGLMVAVAVVALLFAAWRGIWFLMRLVAFSHGI